MPKEAAYCTAPMYRARLAACIDRTPTDSEERSYPRRSGPETLGKAGVTNLGWASAWHAATPRPPLRRSSSIDRAACDKSGGLPFCVQAFRLKAVTSVLTACVRRRSRVAQGPSQRVRKSSWFGELEDVSVGLDVSLLQWRSGGSNTPHDTPPYPLVPSQTFAHSSLLVG
jgi:hypothetical protein